MHSTTQLNCPTEASADKKNSKVRRHFNTTSLHIFTQPPVFSPASSLWQHAQGVRDAGGCVLVHYLPPLNLGGFKRVKSREGLTRRAYARRVFFWL